MFKYTTSPFTVTSDRCTLTPLPWLEETWRTARTIAARTTKPIWLCSSGGIDCEVAAEAFLHEKIPFKVLSLSYGLLNGHDIKFAKEWCSKNNVPHKIIEVSLEKLFTEGIDELIALDLPALWPFRTVQLQLIRAVEAMGGYAVSGGGEQLFDADESGIYLEFEPGYCASLEFMRREGLEHEPYFHFATPEIVRAWHELPIIKFSLSDPSVYRHPNNGNEMKIVGYRSVFPQQVPRHKYDGFENAEGFRKRATRKLQAAFGDRLTPFRIPLPDLVSQLIGP